MWIKLEQEEFELISDLLSKNNLHGLNYMIKSRLSEISPKNMKHNKQSSIKAAQTYFAAEDLIINDDFVLWEDNGDALVMAWQRVPSAYLIESDCNCNNK